MTQNANPYYDPANTGTITGLLKTVFNKVLQNTDGMLPAVVIAYDRQKQRAQVQPLIPMIDSNQARISRAQIASVPVFHFGGGGFVLDFNLVNGDLGWILANDRDISLFLQTYEESSPNSYRVKSFSDAVFFPDVMRGYTIASEDSNNAILQNSDGSVKISLGSNKIKISAPTVEIDSSDTINVTATNQINLNASTNIIATTPLFAVSGNITAGGSITPSTPPP